MKTKAWLAISIAMWFLHVLPTCAQDESSDETQAARLEFIKQTTLEEMQSCLRNETYLRLDDMQRYLDLDDKDIRKARIFAKGVVSNSLDELPRTVSNRLDSNASRICQFDRFAVNGTTYQHVDSEENTNPGVPQLKIMSDASAARLTVQHSSGMSVGGTGQRTQQIEEMDLWEKALKNLDKEKVDEYSKYEFERRELAVLDGVIAILSMELNLNETQQEKMREFIGDKMNASVNLGSSLTRIRMALRSPGVYEEQPDFLSEIQLKQWNLMQSTLKFGW